MTQEMWQERYAKPGRVWSGKVNHWLAEIAPTLPPGTALDLACGEGGDAVWLAGLGWQVTAVDFAPAALARGAEHADAAGVGDRIRWVEADAAHWLPPGRYDLVTMHFFHTPSREVRDAALRTAWQATSSVLLVVAHDPANLVEGSAGGPPDPSVLYSAGDVLDALGVPRDSPRIEVAETRRRENAQGLWVDAVVVLRR
jgi:SAM-dependent methyltransferase